MKNVSHTPVGKVTVSLQGKARQGKARAHHYMTEGQLLHAMIFTQ
jgi:hypothetical protein